MGQLSEAFIKAVNEFKADYASGTFIKNFNVKYRKSDSFQELKADDSAKVPDDILKDMATNFVKEVIKAFSKDKTIPSLVPELKEESGKYSVIFVNEEGNLNATISVKPIPYEILPENTSVKYKGVSLIAPPGNMTKQYTKGKPGEKKIKVDKLAKKQDKRGSVNPALLITKMWDINVISKFTKPKNTLANETNVIFSTLENFMKETMLVIKKYQEPEPKGSENDDDKEIRINSYNDSFKEEIEDKKTEVKDLNRKEGSSKAFEVSKGPIKITTSIDTTKYTIDPSKTVIEYNNNTLYKK